MTSSKLKLSSDEFSLSKKCSDLQTLPLEEVMSTGWLVQQKLFISLNKSAYLSAMTGQDEFVKRLLKEGNKSQILAYELIRISVLKQRALEGSIEDKWLPYWFVFVQSEGILMNLFETIGFHSDFLYSLGDRLPDLIDYCYSNVSKFFGKTQTSEEDQFKSTFFSL